MGVLKLTASHESREIASGGEKAAPCPAVVVSLKARTSARTILPGSGIALARAAVIFTWLLVLRLRLGCAVFFFALALEGKGTDDARRAEEIGCRRPTSSFVTASC